MRLSACFPRLVLGVLLCSLAPSLGDVVINEFMAVNDGTLADADGAYSDWIELYNAGDAAVSLDGWYLTDSEAALDQWALPSVEIAAGGYLVVFASGKDRAVAGEELHTNFRLDGGGEYLALVAPDGETVRDSYGPGFPDQGGDTSFGIVREDVPLVAEGAAGRYLVPDGPVDAGWRGGEGFDDAGWTAGQAAVGFDHGVGGYDSLIFTDVGEAMFGESETLFLRVPFEVPDGLDLESLRLELRYDDGFVAHVNGGEVASDGAPAAPVWDSQATGVRSDVSAVVPAGFAVGREVLRDGENVLALQGLNHRPWDADPDFLLVPELFGVDRVRTYLAAPTPGAANGEGRLLEKVGFAPERGFYDGAFDVVLSTDVAGAEIRYTTDFSDPTASSPLYTGPLRVSGTTVIRAAAFKTGFQPSPASTHTYVFHSQVLTQPSAPAGWPDRWGSRGADYGMRSSVVDDHSAAEFEGFLRSMPSLMIVSSMENLFDDSRGIYDHPTSKGAAWERAGSLEWVNGDGTSGFGENCGVRIQGGLGGGGRSYKKKSWRLSFKSAYGPSKLRFPVFGEDNGSTDTFDQLILRAGGNDRQDYTRDEYARRCQLALGRPAAHGRHVHVYLNGLYWGMYNAVERPAGDFAASYFGGDKDDYDSLAHNANNVIDGDNRAWNSMVSLGGRGLSGRERYMEIQGKNPDGTDNPAFPHYVDVGNYIDYMLANIYLGMGDWPGHNWYAARPRDPGSDGYKFFIWDGEGAFRNNNVTGVSNGAGRTYRDLRANAEFNLQFGDHVQRHLFNGGALTPGPSMQRFAELSASVEPGVVPEQARWGHVSLSSWRGRRDSKLNGYLPGRRDVVVGYLRDAGLYPEIDAPAFGQHGGAVAFGEGLTIATAGGETVYYTLDGSDPREAWTGAALGERYTGPVALRTNAVVKARSLDSSGRWSALSEALFYVAEATSLRVTEVMYHPRAATAEEAGAGLSEGDFEFLELTNTGGMSVGLAGFRLEGGVEFDFTSGAVRELAPGESLLVVGDAAGFAARYPGADDVLVAGAFSGALNNAGDKVELVGPDGAAVWSVRYNDARGWPAAADGAGHSLVPLVTLRQPEGHLEYGGNWRASAVVDGSPGAADPVAGVSLVVNEIEAGGAGGDRVEVLNLSDEVVLLEGWYLSDEVGMLDKWALPAELVLVGQARLDLNAAVVEGLALDRDGGRLFLSHVPESGQRRVVDAWRYKAQEPGVALGRYPDGGACSYPMVPSPGTGNAAPVPEVVIAEVMYAPEAPGDEYVKVCNLSGAAVPLWNAEGTWRLDGLGFEFPEGTVLADGGTVLVVGFDPDAEPERLAAFRTRYGVEAAGGPVVGPYGGSLSDAGERVALERPQTEADGTGRAWVIVDEVIYSAHAPWPAGAVESGRSIVRLNPLLCGNLAAGWDLSDVGGAAGEGCSIPVEPALALAPYEVEVSTPENVEPAAVAVTLRNVGVGTMAYAVEDDVDWLSVAAGPGEVGEGGEAMLSVEFDATALPVGEHAATVTVSSDDASNAPRSFAVRLRVTERDKVPPEPLAADAFGNPREVVIRFSEAVEAGDGPGGAENIGNYVLDGGVRVVWAALQDGGTTVVLGTTPMVDGQDYQLTVTGVRDRAVIPNPVAAGAGVAFRYDYTAPVAVASASGGGLAVAGADVVLNAGESFDPDGGPEPLSYVWRQVHGPAVTLQGSDRAMAVAPLSTKGTYVFEVEVGDGLAVDREVVVVFVSETVSLFEAGQVWRFYDKGEDLGTAWRAVGYDDSEWESGPAQLGYGDGDEQQVVSYGPEGGSKYRTTYFRTEFEAEGVADIGGLNFHILRDDGAVVYLNGEEVTRSNMRDGEVTFDTTAESVVGGNNEDTFFLHVAPADALVEGTNVLAVEIHQISNSSSDISFDLALDTEVVEPDGDGDGLPDYWEVLELGTVDGEGRGDLDGDGLSDAGEFAAGTDPADPGSLLGLWVEEDGGGGLQVRYRTAVADARAPLPALRYYALESSEDGVTWTAVPGHERREGDGAVAVHPVGVAGGTRLFRLRAWVE